MTDGAGQARGGQLLVARPTDDISAAVRAACRRLYAVEEEFVAGFRAALLPLVPELRHTTLDDGQAFAEGLARAVLWAALTPDPPEVVEATFRNVGAEYSRRGVPDSSYHGAGHALLRAARDTQITQWSSELSSGWVAYYSWLAAHLAAGAREAGRAPATAGATVPGAAAAAGHRSARASSTGEPAVFKSPPPARGPATAASTLDRSLAAIPGPARSSGPTRPVVVACGTSRGAHAATGPTDRTDASGPTGDSPSARPPRRRLALRTGPVTGGQPVVGTAPRNLEDVLVLLRSRYFAGNERALGTILTRVALRTGADLRAPRADQHANPAVIANVLAVLQVMGYVVQPAGADATQVTISTPPREAEPAGWWSRRRTAARGWRGSVPGTSR